MHCLTVQLLTKLKTL